MTKPTYSELEARIHELEEQRADFQQDNKVLEAKRDRAEVRVQALSEQIDELNEENTELTASLARVRGLLQRIADAYRTPICTHARMMPVVGQCVCCEREGKVKLKLAIEEALFLSIPDWPQGAESADIGKLDSADETGKVNRVDEKPVGICQECHEEIGYWCMHQAWRDESGNQMFRHSINCTAPIENGSAETGGEKALPNMAKLINTAMLTEAIERVEMMIDDDGETWDLSANDQTALQIVLDLATFRQPPVPIQPGPESAHSGKLNTADKSVASPELLPTQLPKE